MQLCETETCENPTHEGIALCRECRTRLAEEGRCRLCHGPLEPHAAVCCDACAMPSVVAREQDRLRDLRLTGTRLDDNDHEPGYGRDEWGRER